MVYPLEKLIHLRKNTPQGITAIYLNTTLRTLALSLVGIFVPVFIFIETQNQFGESIVIGLYGVILYYFFWRLLVSFLVIPVSKLLSRYGFRWNLLISAFFLAFLLLTLSMVETNYWLLALAAVFYAGQSAFYWLSYRSLFVKDGVFGHLGEEVSINAILAQLVSIGGPALGGLIIAIWGFPTLFLIALILVILSGLPFFFMRFHKRNKPATIKSVISWLKQKKHRNEELSFIGRNIQGFTLIIFWSIFMFLVAGTYERQGLVASLGMITGTIMTYVAGKLFDRKHSLKFFRLGVISTTVMFFLRVFVNSFSKLLSVQLVHNTLSPFYWVTFDSLLYERARDEDDQVLTFMVSRMLMISVAMFLLLGFVILVIQFEWRFNAIWIFAGLATLFSLFMWEKKHAKPKK